MLIVVWATEFHSANLGEKRIHFDAFYGDNWIINSPDIQSLSRLLAIPSNETILHLTFKIGQVKKKLKAENWQRNLLYLVSYRIFHCLTVFLAFFSSTLIFFAKKPEPNCIGLFQSNRLNHGVLVGILSISHILIANFFLLASNLFSWHQKQYLSPMFSIHDISKRSSYKLKDNPTSFEITYFSTKTFAKID